VHGWNCRHVGNLTDLLDDELYALNQRLGEGRYPKSAKAYLDDWASPGSGWLRKYYAAGEDEPQFDALPAVEKAVSFVRSLRSREFIGTESRLNTLLDLLRQMAYGTEDDPAKRFAELHRQRAEIERQIADVEGGNLAILDSSGQRDRFQAVRLDRARTLVGLPRGRGELPRARRPASRADRGRVPGSAAVHAEAGPSTTVAPAVPDRFGAGATATTVLRRRSTRQSRPASRIGHPRTAARPRSSTSSMTTPGHC
jgi:hypothetical protein